MTRLRLSVLACFVLSSACGGKSQPVCPSEKHLADPDGRGERCVDDASSCEAPSDCVADGECCTASCADVDGSGVYECAQSCRSPECTEGSCGEGWRCQPGLDACSAYCVPNDLPCADGWILGDPSGTGTWQCIRASSTCSRDQDCVSADACCWSDCVDQGDAQFECTLVCTGDDQDREAMWECTSDVDCENMMGPGWTCVEAECGGTHDCAPPVAECDSADDCVLATDSSQCCGDCGGAYSLAEVAANECLVVWYGAEGDQEGAPAEDPPVCAPDCTDVACPTIECALPSGADCVQGQCVPVL